MIPTDQNNNLQKQIYTHLPKEQMVTTNIQRIHLGTIHLCCIPVSFNIICVALHHYYFSFDLFNYCNNLSKNLKTNYKNIIIYKNS